MQNYLLNWLAAPHAHKAKFSNNTKMAFSPASLTNALFAKIESNLMLYDSFSMHHLKINTVILDVYNIFSKIRFYMLIKVWPTLMTHLRMRTKIAAISYQATWSKNLWTLPYIITEMWLITMKEEGRSLQIHALGDIEDNNSGSDHTWKELVASDKSSWMHTLGREFIHRPLDSLNPDCLKTAMTY